MKKIILFVLFCFWDLSVSATTLRVEQLADADYELAVQTIGKIVIEGTSLKFYDRQGVKLYETTMEELGKITFSDAEHGLSATRETNYSVYPNPSHSIVLINGLQEPTTLRLYHMDGRPVKSANGTEMNVEDVPAGNYLLQFNNQIVKIIKQ